MSKNKSRRGRVAISSLWKLMQVILLLLLMFSFHQNISFLLNNEIYSNESLSSLGANILDVENSDSNSSKRRRERAKPEQVYLKAPTKGSHLSFKNSNLTLGLPCINYTINSSPLRQPNSQECFHRPLPIVIHELNTSFVDPCLPRFVLLPSYPTSGNSLVTTLFQLSTGFMTMAPYENEGSLIYQIPFQSQSSSKPPNILRGHSYRNKLCKSNLFLPHSSHVALTKVHFPVALKISADLKGLNAIIHYNSFNYTCIHLARNPGDNLIRNFNRWSSRGYVNGPVESFVRTARGKCQTAIRSSMSKYAFFHNYWLQKRDRCRIIYYEHLSNPNTTQLEISRLLQFVGEEQNYELNMSSIVKEPDYEHGSLLVRTCGLRVARELYKKLHSVSDKLGYSFDAQRGIWTPPPIDILIS